MSEICIAFSCTPDAAEKQDWATTQAILDYRNASQAVELFNSKDKTAAFEVLTANPHLLEVLAMMRRAQQGESLTADSLEREGMSIAESYAAMHVEDDEGAE